ncbi:winged helix-turn-helix transcriptional regulator, partial [Streptomyces rimosus]|uniref:winged helix-turn-helix transcriptional regulator n=1 Tax=Streptomyces rimosus TaxID=1927 RepID=UPI001F275F99
MPGATVLHPFGEASEWRDDVFSPEDRAALAPPPGEPDPAGNSPPPAPVARPIFAPPQDDARPPAAAIAARTGHPASTVRRRLARLMSDGRLSTH